MTSISMDLEKSEQTPEQIVKDDTIQSEQTPEQIVKDDTIQCSAELVRDGESDTEKQADLCKHFCQSLEKLETRIYTFPSIHELFHPLPMLTIVWCAYLLMNEAYVPDISRMLCHILSMMGSLVLTFTYSWLLTTTSQSPLWQFFYVILLNLGCQILTAVVMDKEGGMMGLAFVPVLWLATTWCKCAGNRLRFMPVFVVMLLTLVFILASFILRRRFPIPHLTIVLPLLGLVMRTLIRLLLEKVVAKFGPPDMNRFVPGCLISLTAIIANIFCMFGFLGNALLDDPAAIVFGALMTMVSTLAGDLFSRTPIRCWASNKWKACRGKKDFNTYSAEANCMLQARFSMTYPPVVVAIILVIPAACLNASWAKSAKFWCLIVAYIIVCIISDVLVIVVHRFWYPVEGETFLGTARRLGEYAEQWPTYQVKMTRTEKTDILEQTKSSLHPYFRDEISCAIMLQVKTMALVLAGLNGMYTECLVEESICAQYEKYRVQAAAVQA